MDRDLNNLMGNDMKTIAENKRNTIKKLQDDIEKKDRKRIKGNLINALRRNRGK